MDSNQDIELEKWEIKGLTVENAVDWLVSASFISGNTAMFGLANFIRRQDKSISDLQARLRELDEQNQTQAQVLAAMSLAIEDAITYGPFTEESYHGALSLLTNLLEQHADKINKLVEGMCKNEQNQHRRSPKN